MLRELPTSAPRSAVWLRRFAPIIGAFAIAGAASAQVGPNALQFCLDFGFSTEEDFLSRGPEPPDGNPLISDGDLLGLGCRVCARNTDLTLNFDVPQNLDLGLDAADVVTDGQTLIAAFSTELDSPNLGQFTAGDLLATNGAVIPNVALTAGFSINYDIGLDALHFIGDPPDIIDFLNAALQFGRLDWITNPTLLPELLDEHNVDIWFSTEGTAPAPPMPGFLDGDVLSAFTGSIVASNGLILPNSVPAGIPTRGIDFGVDALGSDRSGDRGFVQFSTEIGHPGTPAFGDQDVLGYQNGVVRSGASLVACFEVPSDDLGVDAVLPEPGELALLATGLACLGGMVRLRARRGRRPEAG